MLHISWCGASKQYLSVQSQYNAYSAYMGIGVTITLSWCGANKQYLSVKSQHSGTGNQSTALCQWTSTW